MRKIRLIERVRDTRERESLATIPPSRKGEGRVRGHAADSQSEGRPLPSLRPALRQAHEPRPPLPYSGARRVPCCRLGTHIQPVSVWSPPEEAERVLARR